VTIYGVTAWYEFWSTRHFLLGIKCWIKFVLSDHVFSARLTLYVTAHRAILLKVILSVRLFVTHDPRLNGSRYQNIFYTIRYSDVRSFLGRPN